MSLLQPMSSDKALSGIYQLLWDRRPAVPQVSFSRPDDTTAYDIGDVIFPPKPTNPEDAPKGLEFSQALSYTGTGVIIKVGLIVFGVTPATKPVIDLMLFSAPLESPPEDNTTLSLSNADMSKYVTTISLSDSDAGEVSGHTLYTVNLTDPVWSASTSLYAVPVIKNSYTPTAQESYQFSIGILPRDYDLL